MEKSPVDRGPGWFGPAYAEMMRHDPHAPGSIDRRLLDTAVGLDAMSAPRLYAPESARGQVYRRGARPRLEAIVAAMDGTDPESTLERIARWTSNLSARAPHRIADLRFGGTDEAIIARGSDWCSDVARVAATLARVAGTPSRLVQLADVRRPYTGHTVLEAYRDGRWGCVDAVAAVVYRRPDGAPASAWELMSHPSWFPRRRVSLSGPFRRCAIAEYRIPDRSSRLYRTTRVNAYYRSVLRMADRAWPGGLRWLHGEDRIAGPLGGSRDVGSRARARR